MAEKNKTTFTITVAFALPQQQVELALQVTTDYTVAMAIHRSGLLAQFPQIDFAKVVVGIFGRKVALDDPVKPGDRVEIYRPLIIDPKEARRRRAKRSNH